MVGAVAFNGSRRFLFVSRHGLCHCSWVVKLSELDFVYPEELVATERATDSRIMLQDGGSPREISRDILLDIFKPGDLWVVNDTKVLKRRVFSEQGLEILFVRPVDSGRKLWEVLCPSSRWKQGNLQSAGGVSFELVARGRPQTLMASQALEESFFETHGEMPLPPYIQKARGERHTRASDDREYQSYWATHGGSLAAPTASLHFDSSFEAALKARGVRIARVTLHVGLGTFLPVTVEDLRDHVMHREQAEVPAETVQAMEQVCERGGRIVSVGTTVARTLESMAIGKLQKQYDGSFRGETDLLIRPGFEWKMVDVLITNFHQPCSTLLALVAAFRDLATVKTAYAWAIENRFRLFSYGDMSVWFRS